MTLSTLSRNQRLKSMLAVFCQPSHGDHPSGGLLGDSVLQQEIEVSIPDTYLAEIHTPGFTWGDVEVTPPGRKRCQNICFLDSPLFRIAPYRLKKNRYLSSQHFSDITSDLGISIVAIFTDRSRITGHLWAAHHPYSNNQRC